MAFEKEIFRASDQKEIVLYRHEVEAPKALILVVHGMAEHGQRYLRFAEFAAKEGMNVWSLDLRGHGATSDHAGIRGYFGNEGWQRVVHDLTEIAELAEEQHDQVPVFVFGHSMGSMLAMALAQLGTLPLQGVIISAFPPHPGILTTAGKFLAQVATLFGRKKRKNKLMNALTFGAFNKGIKERKTDFDWLSRDADEVQKYINDPDCGEVFTTGFFYELADLTDHVHRAINDLPTALPLYYITGSDDPVVEKKEGANRVAAALGSHLIEFSHRSYDGARHELLNEINRVEVSKDLMDWIKSKL